MNKQTIVQAATFIVSLLTLFVLLFTVESARKAEDVRPVAVEPMKVVVVSPSASPSAAISVSPTVAPSMLKKVIK